MAVVQIALILKPLPKEDYLLFYIGLGFPDVALVYGLFIGEKIIEYSRNLLLRKNGYGGLAYRDAANIGLRTLVST